jgi:hypothetical protein
MSRVSVQTGGISGESMREPMENLARVSRQMMSSAFNTSRPLLQAYRDVLMAGLPLLRPMRRDCCEVPETSCPPYCVCQMSWEATRGEHLQGTIRVTNTGKQARTFTFDADPFQGPSGDTGAKPTLAPATANLSPNQAVVVKIDLDVGEQFQPGSQYNTDVKIRGLYEQCVRLNLSVQPTTAAHCEVSQGEIPTRLRAHQWYHHFQCEEPCFEPVGKPQEPPAGTVPGPASHVPA